jgi:hypothetical protein
MRHCRNLIGIAAVGAILGCDEDNSITSGISGGRDYKAEAEFQLAQPLSPDATFRLTGINGHIDITGVVGADSVSVAAMRRVEADSQSEADAHLPDLQVEVVASSATELIVSTVQPQHSDGLNYTVNYTVTVPATVLVDVVQANGEVDIRSLTSPLDVSSANGRIEVHDCTADVDVDLGNGEIEAELAPTDGSDVTLRVANGTIDLDLAATTSAELSADASNGKITIRGLSLEASLQTPQSVRGILGDGAGRVTLSVANGTIEVDGD